MQVKTVRDGVYVRASHSGSHKQGKLPAEVYLNVVDETSRAYELDIGHTIAVIEMYDPDRDSDYDLYPNFWISKEDVDEVDSEVVIEPIDVSLAEVVMALDILKEWWKQ